MTQRLLFFLFACLVSFGALAQRSPVDETDNTIDGIPRKGQRVSIQLDNRRVEAAWLKYLGDKYPGKVKNVKGVIKLDGVVVDDVSPTPVRVISKVDGIPTGTTVWWSIDLGNAYLGRETTPAQWKAAEKYLKDFARGMYREDVVAQIAEAEKSLVQSQNSHAAIIAKVEVIKKDVDKNKVRKLEIQQQLAQNAAELLQYNNLVDANLKEQESARADIVNMRLSLDSVKDRMNKIE
ncbi:hypothetical protein [Hymenobacter nivis]|uniref:DNA repair ATPase n=1 Tax=Hymenobacter nivis TaxID=1850093 RepID=A0A2Z3GHW1_9BACT|nr:hypothetical protein [Hymenobacter nivis]AWM33313.1 hypothetical protein DDQ68_11285 [Hymenobacter nivis]